MTAAARFVSEAIEPIGDDFVPEPVPVGEPAVPQRFRWRDEEFAVARICDRWKETRSDTHKSGQQYLYKHWYRIQTGDGRTIKVYFERRPRSAGQAKRRWWLFSIEA